WFLVDNPRVRHIPLSKPDHIARRALAATLLRSLGGGRDAGGALLEQAQETFVNETEGLLLADLNAVAQLARNEALHFDQIGDAVRRYKIGVTDDPWLKIDRAKIRQA